MADIRYILAVILIVLLPIVIAFWFTIHAAIGIWRTRPTWQAYTAALVGILAVLAFVLPNLRTIAGADWGTQWGLVIAGGLIYAASLRISSRVRAHLDMRTFSGLAQVNGEASSLINTGPFSVVRHPRYFMVIIATLGWSLVTNYAGAYALSAAFFIALLIVVRLEERDLVERFGEAYLSYKTQVPMLLPRVHQIGQLFA